MLSIFIAYHAYSFLQNAQQIQGPFLVVVPLSTLSNWAKEFRKWLPDMNVIVYVGTRPSREVRSYLFFSFGFWLICIVNHGGISMLLMASSASCCSVIDADSHLTFFLYDYGVNLNEVFGTLLDCIILAMSNIHDVLEIYCDKLLILW